MNFEQRAGEVWVICEVELSLGQLDARFDFGSCLDRVKSVMTRTPPTNLSGQLKSYAGRKVTKSTVGQEGENAP